MLHFYKLDDHIYPKPKNNELLTSIAHLAILSPKPVPPYDACHILPSNSQAECRHMPQSKKMWMSKCFLLSVSQVLMKCLTQRTMESGTAERALDPRVENAQCECL